MEEREAAEKIADVLNTGDGIDGADEIQGDIVVTIGEEDFLLTIEKMDD